MGILRLKYTGDTLTAEKASKRVHVHTYLAVTDDPQMDSLTLRNDPLCPRELDLDPYDRAARIVSISAKRRGPHQLRTWELTITSTTEVDENPNPLAAPAKWSVQTVLYDVPAIQDREGKYITNTAGSLIEGAVRTVLGYTFTARLSIPDGPITWIDDFGDALNDSSTTIKGRRCPKETVWLRDVQVGEPQKDYGVTHCPSSMVFEYNPLGFDFAPLNRGFRALEITRTRAPAGARGTRGRITERRRLIEILDEKGQPVSEPQFLNRDGEQPWELIDGVRRVKQPLLPSEIIVLRFPLKKLAAFGSLPIRWS